MSLLLLGEKAESHVHLRYFVKLTYVQNLYDYFDYEIRRGLSLPLHLYRSNLMGWGRIIEQQLFILLIKVKPLSRKYKTFDRVSLQAT